VSTNPIGSRVEQLAQALAERILPLVLDAIDMNALIDQIDVNRIIAKVDLDQVIDRVDLDQVIDRVDLNQVIDRIDIQGVIDRVDLNAIVNEIDIEALVEHTELGSIIARSTTGILSEVLDVIRAQGVGLDDFVFRWGNRLIGRGKRIASWPKGPPLLVPPTVTP
jgi:hypothetical protein